MNLYYTALITIGGAILFLSLCIIIIVLTTKQRDNTIGVHRHPANLRRSPFTAPTYELNILDRKANN